MSQRTVPILLSSIAALFIALVVIIVMQLTAGERGLTSERRRTAVRTLLSSGNEPGSLASVAGYIESPLAAGSSLDNLNHFLKKDPGRREFAGGADRRRVEDYLADIDESSAPELIRTDVPDWVPGYLNSVSYLFAGVKSDVFDITGFPDALTDLEHPGRADGTSATGMAEDVLALFAETWIPAGESIRSYRLERDTVRDWLIGSRRFNKRIEAIDKSWTTLAAALYNLSMNPRWKMAGAYAPSLEHELDELITMVLSADIHRRNSDMMRLVIDADAEPGMPPSAGLLWIPEFSYYKNIPELTGYTADVDPVIFFAKVSLAYTFRDSRTQTWVNRRKDWLSDYFQSFFSATESRYFSPADERDREFVDWKMARLKAEAIHGINRNIILEMPFGRRKVYGIRDLALVRVNLLANP